MKKRLLLSLGALFLTGFLTYNALQVELTDSAQIPMVQVGEMEAMATNGGVSPTGGAGRCNTYLFHCTPTGCEISGSMNEDENWYWQYYGCRPTCRWGGTLCCFTLEYSQCT